jgi:hypothetical protein
VENQKVEPLCILKDNEEYSKLMKNVNKQLKTDYTLAVYKVYKEHIPCIYCVIQKYIINCDSW